MSSAWDEETMGTGVPDVDAQNRILIRFLDDIIEAMQAGRTRLELQDLLRSVEQYAAGHFRHEERWMRRLRCSAAEANASAHRHFEAVLQEIAQEIDMFGPKGSLVLRIQRELVDWLRGHIIGCDTKLRRVVPRVA